MSANSKKGREKTEEILVSSAAQKWAEDPEGFFFYAIERMFGIPQKRVAEIVQGMQK